MELVAGRGQGPLLTLAYVVVPPIALSYLVAIRPALPVRVAAFCALLAVCVLAVTTYTTGDEFQDYFLGNHFASLVFTGCYFLLLSNPMADFRHESDSSAGVVDPASLPVHRKAYRALCIFINMRGVGWNYQVRISHSRQVQDSPVRRCPPNRPGTCLPHQRDQDAIFSCSVY